MGARDNLTHNHRNTHKIHYNDKLSMSCITLYFIELL